MVIEHTDYHELLTDVDGVKQHHNNHQHSTTRSSECRYYRIFGFLLAASILVNISFTASLLYSPRTKYWPSKYANLLRNREEPYVRRTRYSSDNETLKDQLWHDINVDHGVVALSDDWVAQHGLRSAQRFPWDTTKGIYILHGFHNLHCLKIVHISLGEYRRGETQSRVWHHISHCLDALRRQILCDADDTPRATERREEVVSGLLQHRNCRSSTELEDFARQHTACYKRPERPDGKPRLERFKHCPKDSGYVVLDDYIPTDEFLTGLPEESMEAI